MINDDTLKDAADFAGMLYTDEQLADVLHLDIAVVRIAISDLNNPLGNVIRNARLKTIAEINRAQIDLALRGSSTAQDAVRSLIRKVRS